MSAGVTSANFPTKTCRPPLYMVEYLSYGRRGVWKIVKTLLELITIEMEEAFAKAGYDKELAKVTLSNRPDL